jgi:hypothetical protein
MSTLNRFRFRATKPHWQHAWVTIGLVAIIACFVAIADGIRSLSVVIVYGIAAISLFLSFQPWRSYLELDQRGFRVAWGAQSTFIRWRDVTTLRPILNPSGRYGGVAFTAAAQAHSMLGMSFRRRKTVSGTIDGRIYGISDGQLYQLMTHLRGRTACDSRTGYANHDLPGAKPIH